MRYFFNDLKFGKNLKKDVYVLLNDGTIDLIYNSESYKISGFTAKELRYFMFNKQINSYFVEYETDEELKELETLETIYLLKE